MYKVLPIDGKDWKIEFSIEASLYGECTEKLIDFMQTVAGGPDELPEGATAEQIAAARKNFIKEKVSGICDIASTTMTMFYAGLLEHHGPEGDRSIMSKKDAKQLIRKYFAEHAEDGTGNFYDLLLILMEQMGEDGFFKLTGVEKMFDEMAKAAKKAGEEKKIQKMPQDHKKASGKQSSRISTQSQSDAE